MASLKEGYTQISAAEEIPAGAPVFKDGKHWYRYLSRGEVIQNGDEFELDSNRWRTTVSDGTINAGLQRYRRKVSTPTPEGRKDDGGKLRWDLLPIDSVDEVIRVLMFGAQKYGDDNWQKVPNPKRRYFAAACRHIFSWWKGERKDSDSNLHPLAHAACCLLFLLWFDAQKAGQ